MPKPVLLRTHSHHSLGQGVPSSTTLLDRCAAMGIGAVALTDTDTMAGVIDFVARARARAIQPLPATTLQTHAGDLILLPRNTKGWGGLCRLLTQRRMGRAPTPIDALEQMEGEGFVLATTPKSLLALPDRHPDVVAGIPFPLGEGREAARRMRSCASSRGIVIAAAPLVLFLDTEDHLLHRLLSAIHHLYDLENTPARLVASPTNSLPVPALYERIYPKTERGVAYEIALACRWGFPHGRAPRLPTTGRSHPHRDLRRRCLQGLRSRGLSRKRPYTTRLARELRVVRMLGFSDYFLFVAGIVDDARADGLPVIGRGSAADSLVSWLLGITRVDPVHHNLLFERFLNMGRADPPDFDLDFPSDARVGVIRRAIRRFGTERCAVISTHVRFRARAAFAEVAKALGVPEAEARKVSKRLPARMDGDAKNALHRIAGGREILRLMESFPGVWDAARRLVGKPRHLGSHPGGLVISPDPITDLVAVQRSAMGPRITQPEMVQIEKGLGLLKADLLGNRSLGVLRDACHWLDLPWEGLMATAHTQPTPGMRRRLSEGRTLGVFYVESPAMRSLLRQLGPTDFEGLVAASSVIRPGVSSSGMKDAYIRRRRGLEPPEYPHPLLQDLLSETLGVMVYQEDVLRVARHLGGLDWAEADALRKISSTKRGRRAAVGRAEMAFLKGAVQRGCAPALAQDLWRQIASFAGYAFCKAHSASYAQESMACLWLAEHQPVVFWAAVLANGGGYYGESAYMEEARRRGIRILPCDLNLPGILWQPESTRPQGALDAIRPGLSGIKSLRAQTRRAIMERRPFAGVRDFLARTPANLGETLNLVAAGAFDFTGGERASLSWLALLESSRGRGGGNLVGAVPDPPHPPRPPWSTHQRIARERAVLGCSPTAPPITLVHPPPDTIPIADLPSHTGRDVAVAGHFVLARGHRTAKGDAMRFLTVEDETGMLECVVWPRAWRLLHPVLRRGYFWQLWGRVQTRYDALTLEVRDARPLTFKT
ncbi:DNA polymerase III subunit alpha [bacterium]|nr:DNA polymerase III subunit alpha [bacterium]